MDRQRGKDQIQSHVEESVFNSEMDRALLKNFEQESDKIRPECYKNYPDSFVERGSGRRRKKSNESNTIAWIDKIDTQWMWYSNGRMEEWRERESHLGGVKPLWVMGYGNMGKVKCPEGYFSSWVHRGPHSRMGE